MQGCKMQLSYDSTSVSAKCGATLNYRVFRGETDFAIYCRTIGSVRNSLSRRNAVYRPVVSDCRLASGTDRLVVLVLEASRPLLVHDDWAAESPIFLHWLALTVKCVP